MVHKMVSFSQSVVVCLMATSLFSLSLVPYGELDRSFLSSLPPSIKELHQGLQDFPITSSYGLFRR